MHLDLSILVQMSHTFHAPRPSQLQLSAIHLSLFPRYSGPFSLTWQGEAGGAKATQLGTSGTSVSICMVGNKKFKSDGTVTGESSRRSEPDGGKQKSRRTDPPIYWRCHGSYSISHGKFEPRQCCHSLRHIPSLEVAATPTTPQGASRTLGCCKT